MVFEAIRHFLLYHFSDIIATYRKALSVGLAPHPRNVARSIAPLGDTGFSRLSPIGYANLARQRATQGSR